MQKSRVTMKTKMIHRLTGSAIQLTTNTKRRTTQRLTNARAIQLNLKTKKKKTTVQRLMKIRAMQVTTKTKKTTTAKLTNTRPSSMTIMKIQRRTKIRAIHATMMKTKPRCLEMPIMNLKSSTMQKRWWCSSPFVQTMPSASKHDLHKYKWT
ncbi:hypothetical protein BDR03DRAFT_109864 [Suillus americanus]|nr:hypothetical protein BDR03DRAFT_109864 [Suillus americanus]